MNLKKDHSIQLIAEAYALDAVDIAKQNFNIDLDWTEESIKTVETILDKLHCSLKKAKPSEEHILQFVKAFGSYIGEVYRKYHPGEGA
jgi:hypothetical protein